MENIETAIAELNKEQYIPQSIEFTVQEDFINNLPPEELEHLAFIAPDNGAVGRRDVYLNSFNSSPVKRESSSISCSSKFSKSSDVG